MTPLEQLLEHAEQATPGERIELRDSIAAHGTDALAALSTWLEGARLGLFAARVIERIGRTTGNRHCAPSAMLVMASQPWSVARSTQSSSGSNRWAIHLDPCAQELPG